MLLRTQLLMSRRLLILLSVLAGATLPPASAHAAAGLDLGFNDERLSGSASEAELLKAVTRAKEAGAQWWRVQLTWLRVAPSEPPDASTARNPGWSGYDWTQMDRVVRAAHAAGLRVLPYTRKAPSWAEGSNRPPASRFVPEGTWRPSPSKLGDFATALAKRYSGDFPDPLTPGANLPRVKWFQAWNEPNLYTDLTPQWKRSDGRWRPASPDHYRKMANEFYEGIRRGDRSARVVSAGTGPFGDLNEGDPRMPPVKFWRELLCIRDGKKPKARKCGKSVRFDAIAHHPYPIGPPRRKARNDDDAVVPDLGKISRLLAPARRGKTLRPNRNTPLWATEYAWESSPDPDGVSLADQALYLEGSLYVLWRQGVDAIMWWQMRDEEPRPAFNATFQSGIFLRGSTVAEDEPKPSYTAFRFPFTAYRSGGVARLWGKTPGDRSVTIQARQGGRWVTAARLRAGTNRIFTGRLRVGPNTPLRAVAGSDTSLTWRTQ